jgi:hypothetical protein
LSEIDARGDGFLPHSSFKGELDFPSGDGRKLQHRRKKIRVRLMVGRRKKRKRRARTWKKSPVTMSWDGKKGSIGLVKSGWWKMMRRERLTWIPPNGFWSRRMLKTWSPSQFIFASMW